MVKVIDDGRFSVYVYDERGVQHHLPHCDVRWSDGSSTQVALPSLTMIVGRPLPPAARQLLREHLESLYMKWAELNETEGD